MEFGMKSTGEDFAEKIDEIDLKTLARVISDRVVNDGPS